MSIADLKLMVAVLCVLNFVSVVVSAKVQNKLLEEIRELESKVKSNG